MYDISSHRQRHGRACGTSATANSIKPSSLTSCHRVRSLSNRALTARLSLTASLCICCNAYWVACHLRGRKFDLSVQSPAQPKNTQVLFRMLPVRKWKGRMLLRNPDSQRRPDLSRAWLCSTVGRSIRSGGGGTPAEASERGRGGAPSSAAEGGVAPSGDAVAPCCGLGRRS